MLLGIDKDRFKYLLHMEGGDSQDETLRAAIAASLQSPGAQESMGEVVDLTADSDDEKPRDVSPVELDEAEEEDDVDLLKAIEMSLEKSGSPSPAPVATEVEMNAAPAPKKESNPGPARMPCGIPGLDRKKQEEERLARLARLAKKRKVTSISPPPVTRELKVGKSEHSGANDKPRSANPPKGFEEQKVRRNPLAKQNGAGSQLSQPSQTSQTSPQSKSESAQRFPTGVVKKTWALGYPRMNDDIKIEELLESSDLKMAVLSSFQWDIEWVFSKLDLTRTKCILVMQAKDDATVRRREPSFLLVENF